MNIYVGALRRLGVPMRGDRADDASSRRQFVPTQPPGSLGRAAAMSTFCRGSETSVGRGMYLAPIPTQNVANDETNRDRDGKRRSCIEQCSDLALPTGSYSGDSFFRCLHQCMGVNDYPEWRPYFPRPNQTRPSLPTPGPDSGKRPTGGAPPPSLPWWLPLALPPLDPFPAS